MATTTMTTRAIVASAPSEGHVPGANWAVDQVTVRELKDDEVLVQIIASGICHTDLVFTSVPSTVMPYPRVAGHEGSLTSRHFAGDVVLCHRDWAEW